MTLRRRSALGRTSAHGLASASFIVLGLYDENPLENELRRRIYEQVQEYPGLHLSELARHVEVDTNHAKYHLRVLEEKGLISSSREDGYWRFYPRTPGDAGGSGTLQPKDKAYLSLLRRKIPLRITLILLDRDEVNASTIQDELDIAASTVHYHTSKMEDAQLLESRKDGRQRVYRLVEPERIRRLLQAHRPPDNLVKGFLEGWEEFEFP